MKYLLTIIFFLTCIFSKSQVVKISTGLLSTSLDLPVDVYDKNISTIPVLIGADYLDNEKFYLSSEIGVISIGSEEKSFVTLENPNGYEFVTEKWSYLHVNTTFRYKILSDSNFILYGGLGPKLDLLISSSKFEIEPFNQIYDMPSYFLGLKSEVGAHYDFEKIRIGFNGTYLLNLKSKKNDIQYNHNTFGFLISLGYKFN